MIRESVEQTMLDKAIALATELHKDQRDKGGAAYIGHPMRVMKTVLDGGHGIAAAIAAVLHDTVEDTDLTIADVEERFGKHVAETVALLSKLPGEDYDAFIDRIIASGNLDAMHVKLADLGDNSDVKRLAAKPTEHDLKRLDKYKRATLKLIDALK